MSWQGGLISGFGSLLGSGINAIIQDKANKKNYEMQKEFAQNSLQWKVEDAKKAGLHPLAAINAQTYAPTPSFVGSDVGSGVAGMSKDFGQAVSGYLDEKMGSDKEKDMLEIERMKLENQKLQKELSSMGQGLFGSLVDNRQLFKNTGQVDSSSNIPLKSVFEVSKDLQFIPTPRGSLRLSLNPESFRGQKASENTYYHIMYQLEEFDNLWQNPAYVESLEKQARLDGFLGKNEKFDVSFDPTTQDVYLNRIPKEAFYEKYGRRGFPGIRYLLPDSLNKVFEKVKKGMYNAERKYQENFSKLRGF